MTVFPSVIVWGASLSENKYKQTVSVQHNRTSLLALWQDSILPTIKQVFPCKCISSTLVFFHFSVWHNRLFVCLFFLIHCWATSRAGKTPECQTVISPVLVFYLSLSAVLFILFTLINEVPQVLTNKYYRFDSWTISLLGDFLTSEKITKFDKHSVRHFARHMTNVRSHASPRGKLFLFSFE